MMTADYRDLNMVESYLRLWITKIKAGEIPA